MNPKGNRLVVGDVGWAETIPEWLLEEVKSERLILGLGSFLNPDIEKVGDAEVCVYLYTANLSHPIGHYLTEVYIYLTSELMKKRGVKLEPFMEEKLKQGLTEDEKRELKELKDIIYRKRGGEIKHPLFEAMKILSRKGEQLNAKKKSE